MKARFDVAEPLDVAWALNCLMSLILLLLDLILSTLTVNSSILLIFSFSRVIHHEITMEVYDTYQTPLSR